MTVTTTAIVYCANGCTRPSGNDRIPVTTTPPALICDHCEHRLRGWLRDIPNLYALLPRFIEHGTTEPDPDGRSGKRTEAPAPMRLEIVDLLDGRRGRRWLGLAPTEDRRGTVGILHAHASRLRDERHYASNDAPTVASECHQLATNIPWLVEQPWVVALYDEVRELAKTLRNAIGERPARPVGECPSTVQAGDCGGVLLPSRYGGVSCARCRRHWDIDDLTRLGLLIGAAS